VRYFIDRDRLPPRSSACQQSHGGEKRGYGEVGISGLLHLHCLCPGLQTIGKSPILILHMIHGDVGINSYAGRYQRPGLSAIAFIALQRLP
jgi:hypothetical protein